MCVSAVSYIGEKELYFPQEKWLHFKHVFVEDASVFLRGKSEGEDVIWNEPHFVYKITAPGVKLSVSLKHIIR